MICDGHGLPIGFRLVPGQAHELPQAGPLLAELPRAPGWVVADKGYAAHSFREAIWDRGSRPAIPAKNNEAPVACPAWNYNNRHRIKNARAPRRLSAGASIAAARREAGIGRTTAYDMRAADEMFARAWDEAIEGGTDRLEDGAFRRAHDGVAEPVISGGRQVLDAEGVSLMVRRYSDSLLTTLLNARRPERFKNRVSADLRADVKVGPDPDASFAAIVALPDGLAARKARGEPTPELDTLPM